MIHGYFDGRLEATTLSGDESEHVEYLFETLKQMGELEHGSLNDWYSKCQQDGYELSKKSKTKLVTQAKYGDNASRAALDKPITGTVLYYGEKMLIMFGVSQQEEPRKLKDHLKTYAGIGKPKEDWIWEPTDEYRNLPQYNSAVRSKGLKGHAMPKPKELENTHKNGILVLSAEIETGRGLTLVTAAFRKDSQGIYRMVMIPAHCHLLAFALIHFHNITSKEDLRTQLAKVCFGGAATRIIECLVEKDDNAAALPPAGPAPAPAPVPPTTAPAPAPTATAPAPAPTTTVTGNQYNNCTFNVPPPQDVVLEWKSATWLQKLVKQVINGSASPQDKKTALEELVDDGFKAPLVVYGGDSLDVAKEILNAELGSPVSDGFQGSVLVVTVKDASSKVFPAVIVRKVNEFYNSDDSNKASKLMSSQLNAVFPCLGWQGHNKFMAKKKTNTKAKGGQPGSGSKAKEVWFDVHTQSHMQSQEALQMLLQEIKGKEDYPIVTLEKAPQEVSSGKDESFESDCSVQLLGEEPKGFPIQLSVVANLNWLSRITLGNYFFASNALETLALHSKEGARFRFVKCGFEDEGKALLKKYDEEGAALQPATILFRNQFPRFLLDEDFHLEWLSDNNCKIAVDDVSDSDEGKLEALGSRWIVVMK